MISITKKKLKYLLRSAGMSAAALILAASLFAGCLSVDVHASYPGNSGGQYGKSPYEESGFDDEYYRTNDDGFPGVSAKQADPAATTAPPESTTEWQPPVVEKEPPTSDLTLKQASTRLGSPRWIQSFCKDEKYYYFLQMTNPYKGHLRLTRVKYTGVDKYTSSYMDLLYFGHGTNLDCSKYKGKTLLWTGGDCKKDSWISTTITAFRFSPGAVLKKHGFVRYSIPRGRYGKKVSNVYPAVNITGNRLAVRYTYKGYQYYQIYRLTGGKKIRIHHPIKTLRVAPTAGDFQGFDITGKWIYMIEGSPSKLFLEGYDKNRVFQPTVIRTINYKTKKKTRKLIRGASVLPFREPEGVKVVKGTKVLILFASGTLTNMAANIYKVR